MSHWDFGRPTDGIHDAPRPSRPAGAAYPADPADGDGAWPAQDGWPDGHDSAAQDGWPAHEGRPADGQWAADGGWPPGGGMTPDGGWQADDGWDEDPEDIAPYPLTYERDDFAAVAPSPAEPSRAPWEPWPPAPYPAELTDADTKLWAGDEAGEQVPGRPRSGAPGRGRRDGGAAAEGAGQDLGLPGAAPSDWAGGGARRGGRRWLIPGGIVVAGAAVGATAVLLTSGHPASPRASGFTAPSARSSTAASAPAAAAPSPSQAAGPLTLTQAQAVLAGYTTANNNANTQRSDTQLATIETGSSYAIDSALYQAQQAAGAAPYPAFSAVQATYYIPSNEPATGQRWFVVRVANAFSAAPDKVTSNEYLLFTQTTPGSAWQDAIEPYLLPGATAPQISVGADGLATAVSLGTASLAVPPGQLPAATAASLDGTSAGQAAIADPGNLADRTDQQLWQAKVPGGTVSDTHTAAAGTNAQEYALQTTDGGALVFYTDNADETITPPAGSTIHLTIPGFYTPTQNLTQATVSYLDQFATYDPPATGGTPRIIADYSAITGKN